MHRNTLLRLVAALLLLACPAASLLAQGKVGEWDIFPIYNSHITQLADAGGKIYYVSSQRLYSYDTDADETYSYSTLNKLSDTNVSLIKYNPSGGYLFIAYATGNIDLLYDDGRVVNMSDIVDATLRHDKAVNDAAFADGRIYAATAFGLVVFDDRKHQVVESGIYDVPVELVAVTGRHLVAYVPLQNARPDYSGQTIVSPLGERHNSLDKFRPFTVGAPVGLEGLEGDAFVTDLGEAGLYRIDLAAEGADITERTPLGIAATQPLWRLADGTVTAVTATHIVTLGPDGAVKARIALPAALQGQLLAAHDDASSVWGADSEGIASYRIGADGTLTVTRDKSVPQNASTVDAVGFITGSKNGSRIYSSNIGTTRVRKGLGTDAGADVGQLTDVIAGGRIDDAAVFSASASKADSRRHQALNGSTRMYGGPQRIAVDPDNADRYYIANFIEGVYVVENNEEIAKFNSANMPTYCFWGSQDEPGASSLDVNIDPEGNLWVGCWIYGDDKYKTYSPYVMLPKEKLGNPGAVTAADWKQSAHRGKVTGNKDMCSLFSSRAKLMFTFDSDYSTPISVISAGSSYGDTADDSYRALQGIADQDGNTVNPSYWICAAEDRRGRIWFGSSQGIYEITNPASVLDATFAFTRLKVPRNDGTNYADYLLDSEQINAIAVDASNRKWVGTQNSGLYLVSENGDAILENFTTDNSPLPTNMISAVYCDPASNAVYVGTPFGLLTYSSASAPAEADYSQVLAYPNPVKPGYAGPVTIKGLMDNSLVKIADAAGNVVYQTRSQGGMAVWDVCNGAGERVRSGVYFVYASQSADGSSSGAVTKILVMN